MTTLSNLPQEKRISNEEFDRIAQKLLDNPETDKVYNQTLKVIEAEEKGLEVIEEDNVPGLFDNSDTLAQILLEDPDVPVGKSEVEVLKEEPLDETFTKPAATLLELSNQVTVANMINKKYIEATRGVISHFCKAQYPKDHYFHYKNVMVIEAGKVEHVKKFLAHDIRDGVY